MIKVLFYVIISLAAVIIIPIIAEYVLALIVLSTSAGKANTSGKSDPATTGEPEFGTITLRVIGSGDKPTDDEYEASFDEPFICPECGSTYDGILCEICGYSNLEVGREEYSDDEKALEDIILAGLIHEEEQRAEEEERERELEFEREEEYMLYEEGQEMADEGIIDDESEW